MRGRGVDEDDRISGWDLGDVVLSWSTESILDDGLYKHKVEKIPNTFLSIESYFESYVAPLIEETRSELCSCLESISEAPHSKIQCIEEAKPSSIEKSLPKLFYFVDVDFWDNESASGCETYKTRNGDIFILSSIKPESPEEFDRYGVTYCMAMVTEVSMDDSFLKGYKVKVSKFIDVENDVNKYTFAIFLTNIMTNIRIWRALHFNTGMNSNFGIIKSVLNSPNKVDHKCNICIQKSGYEFIISSDKLQMMNLNKSQTDALQDVISTIGCQHSNEVKLIWGPPGTGKTKTISAILWAFMHMKCRALSCAPTNIAVVGVCRRLLQLLKHFHEHSSSNGYHSLADVVLFGNRDRMEIDDELHDVFLDNRVDQLVECFAPSTGWRNRIASMIGILEDCRTQYDVLLDGSTMEDNMSFLDFWRKQFNAIVPCLQNCLRNLMIHLPRRYFSHQNASNMLSLIDLLETFSGLLSNTDLTNEEVEIIFSLGTSESKHLPPESGSSSTKIISSVGKALDEARVKCLQLLKVLQSTLLVPHATDKSSIRNYCIQRASIIFCTVSSSSLLHHVEMDPLDVLVLDEAAQLKECELLIPLRLNLLKHAVLVGDERQLRSMVKSQVCKEAGFGISLFERLVSLGFVKHLLDMQYRMHPDISLFPNTMIYEKKILDGPNVKDSCYNNHFLDFIFGPYSFINITDGREESDDIGHSRKNMVEVAIVLYLVRILFKSWDNIRHKLSIGVVSPYASQVNEIKEKLGGKYDSYDGFVVRVKSVDGFQGEEDDVIILSTVRSNSKGNIGFLADNQRTNVALTRAKHCLWILGNASTLSRSGTIWEDLILDAQNRKCLFNASDDTGLVKTILHVKHELDQLDDLLNSDSMLLSNARWKVLFSNEFRKSFTRLKSIQLRREVIQMLCRLASGCRSRRHNRNFADSFQLARIYKVGALHLIWSIDIVKHEKYMQVIRVWDILPLAQIEKLVKRLDHVFSMYTDDYVGHCRTVCIEGNIEVPASWKAGHDILQYKRLPKLGSNVADDSNLETLNVMENSKVSDSLLLMKFYSLSSGIVKHLLTASDGSELDVPFELTDQEEDVIRFPFSTFILGRSGTGKTTILTMKLIQKEQQYFVGSKGLDFGNLGLSKAAFVDVVQRMDMDMTEGKFLKQIFVTVSSKLCSAIRSHICRLRSFVTGDDFSGTVNSLDMHDISDKLEEFSDIPDSFHSLSKKHYPLVITFRKFLMMLDGTTRFSFFDKFYGVWGVPSSGTGVSKSLALQAFIGSKEVDFEKFVQSYWPHFNAQLTKKLDPSTVFTQIISHIKGGIQAGQCHEGHDQEDKQEKKFRITDIFQLTRNFRTHCGILNLAQSIMDLLYNFFPLYVDKMFPETSSIYGEAPILLESSSDENAIITIFGESKAEHGNLNGFGAEQVILVRDDCAKRQILELIGKQALVLTIVECKGLEFQDVLLYNFFGASPLKNKWRVVYEHMKNHDILEPCMAFPHFDDAKHYLLCSELKQLYVAITRARQRLWICENSDEYCKPMFDYWKKLCLVEARHLDSSVVQGMRAASSPEDWRSRGIKLFNEKHYEMASMCFGKAGDEYREKWARAAGLVATADRVISTNSNMGETLLVNAAEIYEAIGKPEKTATCYFKLKDFRKAGTIYLEKCGTSKLEDSGDCFALAKCWSLAADVYFKAKCLSKCIAVCTKGELFDIGLKYLEQWKEEVHFNEQNEGDLDKVRSSYLENCALHYYELGDIKCMMSFVRAFGSMDLIRSFLKPRKLLNELLTVEAEMGNFLEAANISRSEGNTLLEAEMLEKAGFLEEAVQLIIFHVVMNSLWDAGSKGWPLKKFMEKEDLLAKAKLLAKEVSIDFYNSVCSVAEILGDMPKTLMGMSIHLIKARKCCDIRVEFFASRTILDVHLQSEPSKYFLESEAIIDVEAHVNKMMYENRVSIETLVYSWNLWRAVVVEILSSLDQAESTEGDDFRKFKEFCLEFLGVRKEDNYFYTVLKKEASWTGNIGKVALQSDAKQVSMNVHQYTSRAKIYWIEELSSVGIMVLERLELLVRFSTKQVISPYSRGRVVLYIYEIAKFIRDLGSPSKYGGRIDKLFIWCQDSFSDIIFTENCRDGTSQSILFMHDYGVAKQLLKDLLDRNLKPRNDNLSHGQIGRVVMQLLLTGGLTDELFDRIKVCLNKMPQWREFLDHFKTFLGFGFARISLISNFHEALEVTFTTDWIHEFDYISPGCFIYLVECLLFFASSCQGSGGYLYCTKSLLVEMLRCHGCKGYLDGCLIAIRDTPLDIPVQRSLEFIIVIVKRLLSNKFELRRWIKNSSMPTAYYPQLVLKLVTILYLTYLNTGLDTSAVKNLLIYREILHDLPPQFSQKIHQSMLSSRNNRPHFSEAFADALKRVGNPLVVITSTGTRPVVANAVITTCDEIRNRDKIIAMLFPKNPGNVQGQWSSQKPPERSLNPSPSTEVEVTNSEIVATSSPVKKIQEMETGNRGKHKDHENYKHSSELEAFLTHDEWDAEEVVNFLQTALSQLKQGQVLQDFDPHLIEEMRSACDEFRLLTQRQGAAGDLKLRWKDLRQRLQLAMNSSPRNEEHSSSSQNKEIGEEASKSDEESPDTPENAPSESAKEAEAKVDKEKSNKKSRKKNKGKGKGKGKKK
ncbi:uncharacterized protein [Typha latifolia]|uniref:uncharacterized protein isoform X2 n=1 Tax=Typha latifolia TaxID=4733 RepID=UPI003C309D7D